MYIDSASHVNRRADVLQLLSQISSTIFAALVATTGRCLMIVCKVASSHLVIPSSIPPHVVMMALVLKGDLWILAVRYILAAA